MEGYWEELSDFVVIKSVKENREENQAAILFIVTRLKKLGFQVRIEGSDESVQPVIVAKWLSPTKNEKGVVLYNHYDVEESNCDGWGSLPFTLTEIGGRMYGRGVADNKAVLLARMHGIENCFKNNEPLPNILWLIQGEEENGSRVARSVFPSYMKYFSTPYFLEETGYYRDGKQQIYYKAQDYFLPMLKKMQEHVFDGRAELMDRTLGKFGDCPFIKNLPKSACYIAFGPNDYQANIHKKNESMSKALLERYIKDFELFLSWV